MTGCGAIILKRFGTVLCRKSEIAYIACVSVCNLENVDLAQMGFNLRLH